MLEAQARRRQEARTLGRLHDDRGAAGEVVREKGAHRRGVLEDAGHAVTAEQELGQAVNGRILHVDANHAACRLIAGREFRVKEFRRA